jgi:hypothetical protein
MSEDNENNLVIKDDHGDVVQDNGTRMIELESYERIIEGLKISADAASHLIWTESETSDYWRNWRTMLDKIRKACMSSAGLELTARFNHTPEVRIRPMPWKEARDRFRDGIKQSAGGMRQLALCHRGDLVYSRMANDLEAMHKKLGIAAAAKSRGAARRGLIWVPDSYN